jgi:hypothetical protein
VLARIGPAAYKLKLPEGTMIHPVFHISQLKPFTPNYSPVYADFKVFTDLSAQDLLPQQILDCRLVKKGNKAVPQVLVQWHALPATSATWEDWNVLQHRFPAFDTCGQAPSQRGGEL